MGTLGVKAEKIEKRTLTKAEDASDEISPFERSCIRLMWHRHNPHIARRSRGLGFGLYGTPTTIYNTPIPNVLAQPENIKILRTILSICGDEKGHYIIPTIIDHWTTFDNLKNIIKTGAFSGNAYLTKNQITFEANSYDRDIDLPNLDHNVICFSPGGFVDPLATKGEERIRIRINMNNIDLPGRYNQFFKITDLCFPDYQIIIKLTDLLSFSFTHRLGSNGTRVKFIFNEKQTSTAKFESNEVVYYGDLQSINRFCLLFPFIALEKIKQRNDPSLVQLICNHLVNLDENELRKILICMSQNITMTSEYNFYCKLPLTSKLIYDIHNPSNDTTYLFNELSENEYAVTLEKIAHSISLDASLQDLPKNIENVLDEDYHGVLMYNTLISRSRTYNNDVIAIPNSAFNNGYVETRLGTRSVPSIAYASKASHPYALASLAYP
jgi:hypothetical protein